MKQYQQNPVSAIVWSWVNSEEGKSADPADAFSDRVTSAATWKEIVLHAVVSGVIGWFLIYHYFDKPIMAAVVWSISGFMIVSVLFLPSLHAKVQRGFQIFGGKVAHGITWLLLVPFFYLVFVPGRLILKLKGKDPMQREFLADSETYWEPRPPVTDLSKYRRQH